MPKGEDDFTNPDPGIRVAVRVIHFLEALVAYEQFARVARFRTAKLAYCYVGGWLALLGAILGTSDAWADSSDWFAAPLVALAAYRMFDILRWYADLILDRAHHTLVSEERNVLFAVTNLLEVALIAAIWLRETAAVPTAGGAFYVAFTLVTQVGLPPAPSAWAKVAIAVSEVAALVVLLAGIAALIAEIFQAKLKATGIWQGASRWDE